MKENKQEEIDMKKMMAVLLAVVLVLAVAGALVFGFSRDTAETGNDAAVTATDAPEAAQETEAADDEEIELVQAIGVITEVTDEYVMLDAGEMGQIQANLFEDTLLEGVEELAAGQTAIVTYDGKMTRSLPPQVTALCVGVYEVKGTVKAIENGRATVERTEGGDEVVLTLPENAPELAVGDAVTAYTTGISTLSLPPQMNAIAVVK